MALFRFILICSVVVITEYTYSQSQPEVRLKDWQAATCDDSYDAHRLVNRISNIEVAGDLTAVTVSFSENCCVTFQPEIKFNSDTLYLMPYADYTGDYCFCTCCFAIEYRITGLPTTPYQIKFHGKKVERSDDPYPVMEPTSEMYKGSVINRTNKYGFPEGTWITFYPNGNPKKIVQFPEHVIQMEPDELSYKMYSKSGVLVEFRRRDSVESWFEDGRLNEQEITYTRGDTTYTKEISRYGNDRLYKNLYTREYPLLSRGENDLVLNRRAHEVIYHEEYYSDGKRKYLFGKDTSYSWYPTGKLESKEYESGKTYYNTKGIIIDRHYRWIKPVRAGWVERNEMNVSYYDSRKVAKIVLSRVETMVDLPITGPSYEWRWNTEGHLIASPDNWKGPLPWESFPELSSILDRKKKK